MKVVIGISFEGSERERVGGAPCGRNDEKRNVYDENTEVDVSSYLKSRGHIGGSAWRRYVGRRRYEI